MSFDTGIDHEIPAAPSLFAGRYRLQRRLKGGHGVETFFAVDTETENPVILKAIDPAFVHPAERMRFEHETQVLRELNGLGLCALYDAGKVQDRLYMAQEFVPGETLEQVLQRGPVSVEATLRIGIHIATALDVAHGAGVCHRDVKPANIIVDGVDPVGTVMLVDFGFARSPWLDKSIRDDLVGTVRYLAPESAGLLAAPADERSDLYAVGVVLFECLAGKPAFPGPSVSDLLRQHLSLPVPELRSIGVAVPRSVDDLVQRLLRKDPAERYQSAAALAADLTELLAAVQGGDADPRLVIGRKDHRSRLTDPSFVGRYAEVDALATLVGGLSGDAAGLILLEADSGGGKTRLLSEVSQQAGEARVTALHGQGVAQAGQRPFSLLNGVADELVALLEHDAAALEALNEDLADVAAVIVRALPALGRVLDTTAEQDMGPEHRGELPSLAGLRRLLTSVASAERPILLLLDDCQWADTLTIRLLAELFPPAGAPKHLGVIAAFSSQEVPADHALRRISGARTLSLEPLSAEAMAMLAESMAGPLPAEIVDIVVRLADGNPFMDGAVLRGLVESGALVATGDGWTVDRAQLLDIQAARRSAALLVRRLELLSDEALELLSVGAVLGKQFDVVTAVDIAGVTADAGTIIEGARRRRLLWVDDRTGRCSFFHDRIREALLDRLTDDARRELHSRAADALAAQLAADALAAHDGAAHDGAAHDGAAHDGAAHDGAAHDHAAHDGADGSEVVFDLAYHLDAAGRSLEALPYALTAAKLARSRDVVDAAVAHYRIAARAVRPPDLDTRIIIAEGLGDVLTLQGVYREAATQLAEARSLVRDPSHAAALESKLGALAFKQGDIATAKEHLESALARLRRRVPRHRALLLAGLAWEVLVQAVHTLIPRLCGRRSGEGHADDFLAMRVYSQLACLNRFYGGKLACAWAHLRGMNLAERYPPSAELGQADSEHAQMLTMMPWYGRGIRYARRSLEIRRSVGDVWGQGQSLGSVGVVRYVASDFEASHEASGEAIRLLRQTGDQWEVNTAAWNMALSQLRLGELTDAVAVAREVFYNARSMGDETATRVALSVWARAMDGRIDGKLIDEQLAKGSENAQATAELHLAAGLHRRNLGDLEGAAASLRSAIAVAHNVGLRQEYIAPVFPWYATVLRQLAQAAPPLNPALRRSRLRDCAEAVRRARRWAARYSNNAPHALREAGLLASLQGRHRRAARLLARSLEIAEGQGARYEAACTRLASAEIAFARGGASHTVDDARAEVAMLQPSVPNAGGAEPAPTISLFDRFATMLTVGQSIVAATSYQAVEAAIRDSAQALLRAERCHLVPVGALLHETLTTESGEDLYGMSRSMLARAIEAGAPVVAIDATADANESLLLSGIRSALAAPIFVQGEVVSCLYATHRQIGELFGEDEIQLADFIATLAGTAFEHLLGNETRFRSLAQNSSDVITLLDRDGFVSYQSLAVSRVFGLPADAMLGEPITDWVHPDDLAVFSQALASAGQKRDTRIECRFRHCDGSYRDAETTATNLLDEPTVAALVLNTRDVTDRKAAERELREKNMELEKAGTAKDLFLASMSHELRTPLNAIIGFTGVLLMKLPGPLNAEQERQLGTVQRSGEHLLSIINDLLDVAKIDSGAVKLTLEPVDCVKVVDSVMTAVRPLADAKGLTLSADLPPGPLTITSDARVLEQIVINIVNNAIKFTDTGEVSVVIDMASAGAPRIIVTDTGLGIAQADLHKIFTAFERGHANRAGHREGTGLGLHICRRLAELINAEITVESTEGAGSVFSVVLSA